MRTDGLLAEGRTSRVHRRSFWFAPFVIREEHEEYNQKDFGQFGPLPIYEAPHHRREHNGGTKERGNEHQIIALFTATCHAQKVTPQRFAGKWNG